MFIKQNTPGTAGAGVQKVKILKILDLDKLELS